VAKSAGFSLRRGGGRGAATLEARATAPLYQVQRHYPPLYRDADTRHCTEPASMARSVSNG
jgi:hypothetical protein